MGVGMCYELLVYIVLNIYLVIEWSCCLVDDGKVSTCKKKVVLFMNVCKVNYNV
jgi:hypothetical protein